ncbi:DUF1802 family protein [Cohnella terricola]|uniref:DUF1802 family protein n=1 Tax=Cohnella terricola TaxID=1289167 RepID=A0A559JBX5_9BACL|nr:DUF1802 family protein [Cohnella terricola]TVX97357.1 DUF1802 family protein [Cohnella terricola]
MDNLDNPIALREWAVAVKALEEGKQVIVLRKGGIAEETKEFKLESPSFYLFPSFEHQRPELIVPEASGMVAKTQAEALAWPGQARVTSFAEVVEDIEVTDAETLRRLEGLHIWTENYAEERLKWKKTKPLHVLILRVFKLDRPQTIPMLDSYGGCKSWISLEELSSSPMKPVLDDLAFSRQAAEVKKRIFG